MACGMFDVDSSVIIKETLDEAVERALIGQPDREQMVAEIKRITDLGMEGKLPFKDSVRQRIKVVPIHRDLLKEIGRDMVGQITPGMPEVFKWLEQHGHTTYLITGGFEECVLPIARALDVPMERCIANRFVFDDRGYVSGVDETSLPWTNEGKGPALRAIRAQRGGEDEVFIMIGDGMNDYKAYECGAANMFIGFGANKRRAAVVAKAPHFVDSSKQLLELFKKFL